MPRLHSNNDSMSHSVVAVFIREQHLPEFPNVLLHAKGKRCGACMGLHCIFDCHRVPQARLGTAINTWHLSSCVHGSDCVC